MFEAGFTFRSDVVGYNVFIASDVMFLMFSDMVLLLDMFYCCQICFIVIGYVLLLLDMFYCCWICFIVVRYVFADVGYDVLLLVRHIHVICRHYAYMLVTSARVVAGMVIAQSTLQYT